METRIIICGSRNIDNQEYCFSKLDEIIPKCENVEIISGHAKGADRIGEEYARLHSLEVTIFPADWKRNGKMAGPIRNRKMLLYAMEKDPLVIAFWDGSSPGTKNMIDMARASGVKCHLFIWNDEFEDEENGRSIETKCF